MSRISEFNFDPPNGLLDKNVYPTNPGTEDGARGQIQEPMNQIKDFVNRNIVDKLNVFEESNLVADGYQKLPSGLILQWGWQNDCNNGTVIKFKKSFPNGCFYVGFNQFVNSPEVIGMKSRPTQNDVTICSNGYIYCVYWFAIGY